MIYVYNQTSTPQWELRKVGDGNKITVIGAIDNKSLGIRANIDESAINFNRDDLVNHYTEMVPVSEEKCRIQYGFYNNEPRLTNIVRDFSNDIIFLNLDVHNKELIRINSRWVTIHQSNLTDEKLTLILHLFQSNNTKEVPFISIVTKNKDEQASDYEEFNLRYLPRDKEYKIQTRQFNADENPAKGERGYINLEPRSAYANLRTYRPSKITYVVVMKDDADPDIVTGVRKYYDIRQERNKLVNVTELNKLSEKVHITAISFMVPSKDQEEYKKDYVAYIKNNFGIDAQKYRFVYLVNELGNTYIAKRP